MFDEYLEPPRVERLGFSAPAVPVLVHSTGTPSFTTIDQDAPSPSHSPSSSALQSPSSHQGVAVGSTIIQDNPFAPVDNNPLVNVFAPEPSSEASSSRDVSSAKSTHVFNHIIISGNGARITCLIMSLAIPLDRYPPENNLQLIPYGIIPTDQTCLIIASQWIYKVKLDEYGDVLKNKAHLVAKWISSKRGIDFENPLHADWHAQAIRASRL
ncbi:hypothetical protein Tco_1554590 [Tanacetum coccineum]